MRDAMNPDLLRPPAHRGPLIAAGAVVLAVGIALEEVRLADKLAPVVHFLVLGLLAALALGIGLQARPEEESPPAFQSVLLVTGLLAMYAALLRFADVLGVDFSDFPAFTFVWTSFALAGVALWAAFRLRSAVCALIGALAVGVGLLSALNWIFGADSQGPFRWLLLVLAIAFVLVSLVLRGLHPRHAEQLINAAGIAILVIPLVALGQAAIGALSLFGGTPETVLPAFWELVVLAAGCGLLAFGAVDMVPGAAYLGVANLVAFVAAVSLGADETLLWWPLLLILLGLGALGAGLRPRSPLPPEPDPYRAGEQPLAARTDEEITLRVRDDEPPA
jgi:hypothetical protein